MYENMNRKQRLAAKRQADQFRQQVAHEAERIPGSEYLTYLGRIGDLDLASTILVQIPSYRDAELLKTIQSARSQAANPDRVRFAVCLQDIDENRRMLDGIPGLKHTFIPAEQASGSCRARWECQELYDGEDYVFITDSHMRFARFWDVMEIAQWESCKDENAVLSEYSEDYSALADEDPGSAAFTEAVIPYGRYVGASYFRRDSCTLCLWSSHQFDAGSPVPGAFTGCMHVFGPGSLNSVRFDPEMCFLGDEFATVVRWWTHGYNIYHPSMRYVFHLNVQAKRKAQSGHRKKHDVPGADGISPREKEISRMEQLFGIADHGIDLGRYGPGNVRSLAEYEEFSGVCFRNRTFRAFSRYGPFGTDHTPDELALFDWQKNGFERHLPVQSRQTLATVLPKELTDAINRKCAAGGVLATDAIDKAIDAFVLGMTKTTDPATRFRAALETRITRLPGTPYLEWLSGIGQPDLASRISVEIPAYNDVELQKTIKSAIAMAAVPDRVHFAVCLQGGTTDDRAFLESLENCRYTYYEAENAPGLCAARADCQDLLGSEEFVLRIDSHMRFAWGWDVALLRQWSECGDPKALVTEHPLDYSDMFNEPVDSDLFTRNARLGTEILNAGYFSGAAFQLRTIGRTKLHDARKMIRGAFVGGGMCFCSAKANRDVPWDRDMFFVADEGSTAPRYFTHGYNVYHPYARVVYHLYYRSKIVQENGRGEVARFAPPRRGQDGLTKREREIARMTELIGLSGENKYGLAPGTKYGLGTERTLQDFEEFSGISYRDLSIRKFAYSGRFDVPHGPEDLAFVDWAAARRAEKREVIPGNPVDLILKKTTVERLKGWQAASGTPLDILVRRALESIGPQ